ncbi:mitochondrial ornithine transporter 1-like isoform X1 [Mixophyes fleayi]|uniref:mitochondrial ornithine transporter 1-like isoform X1 n=1 Tax=Mixophyes fleayi TaxID=3061075 RepID=UPI003F4E29A5
MSSDQSHPIHVMQVLINMTSGAMGGLACVVSGQPFDTAKVKMQTFPFMYRGFLDCTVRTYHTEGLRGLYHGTIPALVANMAENAVLFACYGFCQNLVSHTLGMQDTSQLRDYHKATAGSLASIFSSLVLCPTELVKCRMQTQHEMRISGHKDMPRKSTPWSIVCDILKSEGVFGLFRGLSSTWLREIPGYFFFFGGYELSSSILNRSSKHQPGEGEGPRWLCSLEHCDLSLLCVLCRCFGGHSKRWCGRGLFLALCVSCGLRKVKNSGSVCITFRRILTLPATHIEDGRNPHSVQWPNAHSDQSISLQCCSLPGL